MSKKFFILWLFFSFAVTLVSTKCESPCMQLWDCVGKICIHKDLFPNWRDLDIVGMILILIACALANVAGIGGGSVFLPILLIIFQFTTSDAVPMSSCVTCGVQLCRLIISYWERHPKADRPTIDYALAGVFTPSIVLGTSFGVLLNQIIPNIVCLILIIVVMFVNIYSTIGKAVKIYKKEKKALRENEEMKKRINIAKSESAEVNLNEKKISEANDNENENCKMISEKVDANVNKESEIIHLQMADETERAKKERTVQNVISEHELEKQQKLKVILKREARIYHWDYVKYDEFFKYINKINNYKRIKLIKTTTKIILCMLIDRNRARLSI